MHTNLFAKKNISAQTITVGTVTGNISSCAGIPSSAPNVQQFTVSGNNLTDDILAAVSSTFELSFSPTSGFSNNLTLPQIAGTVQPTIIYVRSSAIAPAGSYKKNVVLTSTGAVAQNVLVTGIVNVVPSINAIANQEVDNDQLTTPVSFSGIEANTFTWTNDTPGIGLPASGSGGIPSFKAINKGIKPITATITVMSTYAGFAYIANTSSNTVSVINTVNQAVVATIRLSTAGPRGLVISPNGNLVYVASSSTNTVSVIDATTNKEVYVISPGNSNPSGIAISPDGSTLYITSYLYNTIAVVNALNYSFIGNIPVGQNPFAIAVTPDGSEIYVANVGTNTVSVISALTRKLVTTVTVGAAPQGIAISPDGSKAYTANFGSNTVSVIDIASNKVTATIPVGSSPYGIAVTPDGNSVYVANSSSNNVSEINALTNLVETTIQVGTTPFGVSATHDGNFVYVTDYSSNEVSMINTANNTITKTVNVGTNPHSLGVFIAGGTVCTGIPATFTITVNPTPTIIIPNTFTPNGDGINDTWNIKYIDSYPKCRVQIFNRYGTRLFFSNGYPVSWNGNYKGTELPDGTYYYIINLDPNFKPIGGSVTIIR